MSCIANVGFAALTGYDASSTWVARDIADASFG
jgi:hypothetical protein